MSNPHSSIYLNSPGATSIVLFIHGFMGSPQIFNSMTKAVHNNAHSAAALLLPGHGGSAKDFGSGTAECWQNFVNGEVERFSRDYPDIWLASHSMGGLLALNAAVKYSETVRGVFAIACPLKLTFISRNSFKVRAKQLFGGKNDPIKVAYMERAGVPQSAEMIFHSLKPASEVTKLMSTTKANLHFVTVPVTAVYSAADELVSTDSASLLKQGLTGAEFRQVLLTDSLHAMYTEREQEVIEKKLLELVGGNRQTALRK